MANQINVGLIGLDTSHVTAFTRLLNEPTHEFHVPGGRVVAAFAGGSPDFAKSIDRVEGFTRELHDDWGVEMLQSPAAVAQKCDAILLTAVDGRTHWPIFQQIAPFGKPTFIDKPFATSYADAQNIAQMAHKHQIPLMSASSLRFAAPLQEAVSAEEILLGADCCGPMELEATQPGLFWYGIHSVEMLFALLGRGCESVRAVSTQNSEFVTGIWRDGRIGTVRGYRGGKHLFGALLHGPKSSTWVEPMAHPKPAYAGLLESAMTMFQSGQPVLEIEETLEIVRFIEAANQSRATGETVNL